MMRSRFGLIAVFTVAMSASAWAMQDPSSEEDQNASAPASAPAPPPTPEDARDRVFYPGDTEHVKPLARKMLGNIWLDQKEIWSSPFRMNRENSIAWIGMTGITAALIATDRRSSTLFENSSGQIRWGNHISNIGSSYTLIPLVAGFYAYGVGRDDPKAREVGVLGAEALLDSMIVVQILKPLTGRRRPDSRSNRGEFLNAGDGFPSGHAIASWSFASLLAHEYADTKFVPVVAYGLAAVVSTARFAAQKHYASDIAVGGTMGWFIGRYVYKTHMDHAIHQRSRITQVTPLVQPSTHTYGVALSLGK